MGNFAENLNLGNRFWPPLYYACSELLCGNIVISSVGNHCTGVWGVFWVLKHPARVDPEKKEERERKKKKKKKRK